MSHTKGPWKIDASNGVIKHENGVICDMYYPVYPAEQPDELSDNARLIAAAPELLALAKWLVAKLEAGCIEEIRHPSEMAYAKEVIARAKGK